MRFDTRRAPGMVMIMALLIAMTGFTVTAQDNASPAPAEVVREVLVQGSPDGAPGQVLQLVRYTIPGNTRLPVHIHPGMQAAWVESGTLHYTVLEGVVHFTRADGTEGELNAGEEAEFLPGDSLVEAQGMVHFGENRGDEPVVLLVASLFEADVPPSTVVDVATPRP